MNREEHPYFNKRALLATQHRKGEVVAPEFKSILGMHAEEIHVDTDSLGTFTGEIARVGTAKDVVIAKARLAIVKSGNPFSIASEGSIGVDPLIPFINSDIEHMAFIDEEHGFTVVETIRSTEIVVDTIRANSGTPLEEFLRGADFPHHKLIIRSVESPTAFSIKGIDSYLLLEKSLQQAFKNYPEVIIESDLRAHCSPSRMANIALVAHKLALRLSNLCPECLTPGWGVVGFVKGLPCTECEEISEEALKAEILGCVKCSLTREGKILAEAIDPSRCDLCNP
jgi:hypothetical protein